MYFAMDYPMQAHRAIIIWLALFHALSSTVVVGRAAPWLVASVIVLSLHLVLGSNFMRDQAFAVTCAAAPCSTAARDF